MIADNKKQMHQVLGNLCLVVAGIFPLISSGLEVLAPAEVGRPAGIVLNFFVSASSFLLSKFAFQTYEVGHGRACYLISAEIQSFLVGANGYDGDDSYRKFYETVREILDSDQTSFIGAGVTEGNPNALADFIRNNNLSSPTGAPASIVAPPRSGDVGGIGAPTRSGDALDETALDRIAASPDVWSDGRDRPVDNLVLPTITQAPETINAGLDRNSRGPGGGLWVEPGSGQAPIEGAEFNWPEWQAKALAGAQVLDEEITQG